MNSQELRALQEAYTQVYQELDEALDPKFGSMRKRGGRSAPPEERTVGGEMNRRNKDYWADTQGANRDRGAGNKAKRRAAELNKEEVETDLFDYILEHLVAEGYADTNKAALAIMANMSEEWKQSIIDEENHPVYGRGGEQRRTQTPRQIGVKGAPHNIPKGGTTISDRDPEGKRLFTGNQDRGQGNKARRRAGKEVEDTRG